MIKRYVHRFKIGKYMLEIKQLKSEDYIQMPPTII